MKNLIKNIPQLNENSANILARTYNILDYPQNYKKILEKILPNNDFSNLTKLQLHNTINEILINHFKGENGLKAKLVSMFKEADVTSAFEIKVNSSRVDFLTVNGNTKSFEIKSEIDNLYKLAKQASDYEKVFEYNFVVIHEKHLQNAIKLLPKQYGIFVLEKDKLVRKKDAKKNNCLVPEMQLKLFTKKELMIQFKGVEPVIENILDIYSSENINESFKSMLKKRYDKKWQFLKQNINEIFPIDYQYFFQHNIHPKIIYGS